MPDEPVIRFPGDQLALAMGGHQWKPALPFRVWRSVESWAHRCETIVTGTTAPPRILRQAERDSREVRHCEGRSFHASVQA